MSEIKKQKAVIYEAWLVVEAAGVLQSDAIAALTIATDIEHKAFMAWRVECSKLKTLEDNNA